jgi:S-formylglutathione hydrolase
MRGLPGVLVMAGVLAGCGGGGVAVATAGRVETDTVASAALASNAIGDAGARQVLVYLPPGYDEETSRRWPVLYLLHGMTSTAGEWVDGTYQDFRLQAAMDSLADAGERGYIVVMPDADNRYGGSFYVSSETFGGWEDFVVRELVSWIDDEYRTVANVANRGLAGFSMGGFGALYLGMRHPDVFGSVFALSPCCLGFVGEMAPGDSSWVDASTVPVSFEQGVVRGTVRRAWMLAAAFAPAGHADAFRFLPFVADASGAVTEVPEVATRWREHLPLDMLAADTAALRGTRVVIDYGAGDQIPSVVAGSRAFSALLAERGIAHTVTEFDGDHVGNVRERFHTALLPFFARSLGH